MGAPLATIVMIDFFKHKRFDVDGDGKADLSHGEVAELSLKRRLLKQGILLDQVKIIHEEVDADGDGALTLGQMEQAIWPIQKKYATRSDVVCFSSSVGFDYPQGETIHANAKKNAAHLNEMGKKAPFFQALADAQGEMASESLADSLITVGNTQFGQQSSKKRNGDPVIRLKTTATGFDLDGNGTTDATITGFKPKKVGVRTEYEGNSFAAPDVAGKAVAAYIKGKGYLIQDPAQQKQFKFTCAKTP